MTLLVPAYNEEGGIDAVVRRLAALDLGQPTELLVIEDGSTDATLARLEQLERELPALRVLTHDRNRGYGAALKTGFQHAEHDVVVITDADTTYPEDRIVDLLARVENGAEMAVGSRTGDSVKIPLVRRPAKAALRLLASYLAGKNIPDLNSGLRAIRRDLVLQYRAILPHGFSFTTTITLAALTNDHRVDYVSIDYAARTGSSKIRPIRDTLGFTALIIRTVLYFNPLKVFYPVAGTLFLVFLGSLIYDLTRQVNAPNLTDKTVLMFVAVVQVLTVGLLADLIEKKSRL
ncbi:MAG: glycosyltransferase family 2 protein [bacterium]|nr:glycosyltransferase family 2 protein [bacterium]